MENKIFIANIEIKPGMILYLDHKNTYSLDFWIVFPLQNELGVVPYNDVLTWVYLKQIKSRVSAIRDLANNNQIDSGKLLWEDCLEITMEQIAEKFGVNVNQIKIKK